MAYIMTKDGEEIFYRDLGEGKPVILIHGWPLSGDSWDIQANYLAENGLRVISYDRRGFGRSGQSWNGYDYDSLAADLHALIEKLNLADVTLVGFSMGSGEVVRYLTSYGTSRVSRAVLISAVTPFLLKTEDNPDGIDSSVFEKYTAEIRKDRPAFLKEFAAKFYGRTAINHTVSEEILEWTLHMAFSGSLRSTLATAQSWSTTDFRDEMRRINIPVLLIHGTSDKTLPIDSSARRALELLPYATLSEYEGEPHGLLVTAADRVNEELLEFVGSVTEQIPAPVF